MASTDLNEKNEVHEIIIEKESLTSSKSESNDVNTSIKSFLNETKYNVRECSINNQNSMKELTIEQRHSEEVNTDLKAKKVGNDTSTGEVGVIYDESNDINTTSEDQEETKNEVYENLNINKKDCDNNQSSDIEECFKETEKIDNELIKKINKEKDRYDTEKCEKMKLQKKNGVEISDNESNDINTNIEECSEEAEQDDYKKNGKLLQTFIKINKEIRIKRDTLNKDTGISDNESNDINTNIEECLEETEEDDFDKNGKLLETIKINKEIRMKRNTLNEDESSSPRSQSSPPNKSEVAHDTEKHHASTPESYSPTSSLDLNEDESTSFVEKRKSSLPYFHLPNPKLDDFLIETEKNLSVSESKEKASVCPKQKFVPKNTGDIVFDVEKDSERNHNKKSRAHVSLYQKMKSINEVKDSTPGLKRCLLKDCLKEEIQKKKLEAFNRKRENERLNNEIEYEVDFEVEKGNDADYESPEDEDVEQATASFDEKKSHELISESNSLRHLNCDDSESSDDQYSDFKIKSKSEKSTEQSNNLDFVVDSNISIDDESSAEVELIDVVLPPKRCQDDDDDDDDIQFVKSKKIKILEEDSDSNDCEIICDIKTGAVHESKTEEKLHIEDNSTDSILFLSDVKTSPKCIEKKSCVSKTNDIENGCNDEISSSIPSFQPHGGFVCESQFEEVDAIKAAESMIMQVHKKYSICRNEEESYKESDSNLDAPVETESRKDADAHKFGFTFDNPPISQPENEKSIFSSQDIADVCSGIFKYKPQEMRSGKDNDKTCMAEFCEPRQNAKDFIETEAELSGDDDGIEDEKDDVDEGNILDMVDDHEVPHAEELREDIAGYYMKQKRDDDLQQLNLIQEQIILDGELNNNGIARQRKYVWNNKNNQESAVADKDESSDESDDEANLTWSDINKDKAKFLQENTEDDFTEVHSSCKKPNLKIKIIGKPEFIGGDPDCTMLQSVGEKRSRNSVLNMDEDEASQIVKRLKMSDDGGSRTTKHVLFKSKDEVCAKRNDLPKDDENGHESSSGGSVFNKFV